MAALVIADVVKFEVSLEEIIGACRDILKNTKDIAVKEAVKTMFLELKKADDALIDHVLTPLFGLGTKRAFDRDFASIRTTFKGYLLKGHSFLSEIQCGNVTDKLIALQQSQAWKKNVPILNRSLMRLRFVTERWIADDSVLYQADQRVRQEINDFLDDVAATAESSRSKALAKLQVGLKNMEDSFVRLKKHLMALERLASQL